MEGLTSDARHTISLAEMWVRERILPVVSGGERNTFR